MKLAERITESAKWFLGKVIPSEATGFSWYGGALIMPDLEPLRDPKGGASIPSESNPNWLRVHELPKEIDALQGAVRTLHGCDAEYLRSEHVGDQFHRQIVWDGFVCVFRLFGHATAKNCYAWRLKHGDETKLAAILESPPVDSVESAVEFAMLNGDSTPMTD